MKKFNELNLGQQSHILKFIEDELRGFMKNEHITIFFKSPQNDDQIRNYIKKIAWNTVFDDNGNVLVEESLRT